MKSILPMLAVAFALPLSAQGTERHFMIGVQSFGPTFEAKYQGIQDGQPVAFDTKNDLALQKDGTGRGIIAEYQGPRFGFELMGNTQDYKGSSLLTRDIIIDGKTYSAGAKVESDMSLRTASFNFTIRVIKGDYAWLGIDLGGRVQEIDLNTIGTDPLYGPGSPPTSSFPPRFPRSAPRRASRPSATAWWAGPTTTC